VPLAREAALLVAQLDVQKRRGRYGGKSIQKLCERMGGYRSPGPKSTTNIRNRQNILELLAAGAAVDIYALPDNGLMHYGPFHLNLAAALEDSIIKTLRPEWNRPNRKNRTTLVSGGEEAVPAGVDTSDSDTGQQAAGGVPVDNHIPVVSTFEFTLQPTYRNQGFFNAGVTGSLALDADGEEIEIFFGDETIPTLGSINRVTTGNDTPRGSVARPLARGEVGKQLLGHGGTQNSYE
jgi:hypothetical protein